MPTEIDEKKVRWQRSRVWALSWLLGLMSQLEPEGVCSIVTGVQASFPMVSNSCGFHIYVSSWHPLSSPPFFGRINSIPWSHLTRHNRSVSQAEEELCDDSWLRRLTHISKICPVNVFDKPESRPLFCSSMKCWWSRRGTGSKLAEPEVSSFSFSNISFIFPKEDSGKSHSTVPGGGLPWWRRLHRRG